MTTTNSLDANQTSRDALIKAYSEIVSDRREDIIVFKKLRQEGLEALDDCNYIFMNFHRMPLNPREVLDLMEKFNSEETEITALGYATAVTREDYNIFIDGFEVRGVIPDKILRMIYTLTPMPDEITFRDGLRVWYD